MNLHVQHMLDAIAAVEIYSPTSFAWFGTRSPQLPRKLKAHLTPEACRGYLKYNLISSLYGNFYCLGAARPYRFQHDVSQVQQSSAPFIARLSEANCGSGRWEGGWEVKGIEEGLVIVQSGGLQIYLQPEECGMEAADGQSGDSASTPTPGSFIKLRTPKELLRISPGFYTAQSDCAFSPSNDTVRLYWNLTSEGAVALMSLLTRVLNDARLPFRLKVVDHPTSYVRCDAAVLYIPRGECSATMEALEPAYAALESSLRSQVPVFTKELAPGLGLAESPDTGESFGLSRCALLAEGLIRAYEQGKRPIGERLHAVLQRFAEAEIDPHKPYLNAGSSDQYHFTLSAPGSYVADAAPSSSQARLDDPETYLETAHSIARRLVAGAVWDGEKCNWIGARLTTDIGRSTRRSPVLEYAALGLDLYSGTAGVALFLAEEQALTGDQQVKEAALGAIHQALDHTSLIPEHLRLGLYTGWMGVALSAARVGVLTQEACLLEQAQALSLLCAQSLASNGTHEHDLMGGSAGAIIASLSLREMLWDAGGYLLDFAISLGESLLQAAHSSRYGDGGYCWESVGKRFPRSLTGLSHGASGIGYALLELAAATRDEQYLNAAHGAFRYERHWLDPVAGNWPDFRENRSGKKHGVYTPTFATQWCHGAPGIALSRLRAYAALGDPTARDEALLALNTTARWVERALTSDDMNYSLCHGLAGNADVLMQGSLTPHLDTASGSELAHDVARRGIEKYAAAGYWPCGAGGGVAPGLMLGLAGIGYFYLRLYKPSIPSVLLVQHEEWKRAT